jgi:hypothetical protein
LNIIIISDLRTVVTGCLAIWGEIMNKSFLTGKRTRMILFALLILPWLLLWLCRSVLSPSFSCLLGFVAVICMFVALAVLFTPARIGRSVAPQSHSSQTSEPLAPPQSEASSAQKLPAIPRTAAEAYRTMSPSEFEVFSAAVIVGSKKKYSFVAHSGGPGDRGVDARLRNKVGLLVIVQSKRNAPHNAVGSPEMMKFAGAIRVHDAVYGYFVTTSRFTRAACRDRDTHGFIHTIDGRHLDSLLRTHLREIAQAYRDILAIKKS